MDKKMKDQQDLLISTQTVKLLTTVDFYVNHFIFFYLGQPKIQNSIIFKFLLLF